MNIMLTSAGRRSYLVRYFKEALNGIGIVTAANSIDNVPAFADADVTVVTPFIYEKEYIPFLIKYCKMHGVDAIIPLYDVDIPILARNREKFAEIGTTLIVSNENFVEKCNDKWETFRFLNKIGVITPKTYLTEQAARCALKNGELSYPVMIKPRFGNGSIALNIATNETELVEMYAMTEKKVMSSWLRFESNIKKEKVIVQEFIVGEEYGMDIINDLNGCFRSAILKKKLAMRAGETDSAVIVQNDILDNIAVKISEHSKHIGNLDCDFLHQDGKFYLLEMNARFGGGYPFSHIAGVDLPLAIIKWLNNEVVDDKILKPTIGVFGYKDINVRKGN